MKKFDPRLLYIILFIVVAAPFFLPLKMPIEVSPPVKAFYETVKKVPKDKLVIVAANWDPFTEGENRPQTRACIEQLMREDLKFAILSETYLGAELAQDIAKELAKRYNKKYGIDWCNWGYKPGGMIMIQTLARNYKEIVPRDIYGTPIEEVPVMRNIKSIKEDVGLVAEFTGSGTLYNYMAFIGGPYKIPILEGCTAIIGPENRIFLDTGQIQGLLTGLSGAAEYEKLLKSEELGTKGMPSQSAAHLLVIILIILGNILYFSARRRK